MSTNLEKAKWLTGLLAGWGIRESWAKLIAGAAIGALCAIGVLSLDSCSALSELPVRWPEDWPAGLQLDHLFRGE